MSVYSCHGCFGPSATPVQLKVGATFGMREIVRMQFCTLCSLKVWRLWPVNHA